MGSPVIVSMLMDGMCCLQWMWPVPLKLKLDQPETVEHCNIHGRKCDVRLQSLDWLIEMQLTAHHSPLLPTTAHQLYVSRASLLPSV